MAIHTGVNLLNGHPEFLQHRWRPIVVLQTEQSIEHMTTRIQYQTPDGQKHVTPGFSSLAEADKWFTAILALEQ